MSMLVRVALAAGLLAAPALPAQAHPTYHFAGGCSAVELSNAGGTRTLLVHFEIVATNASTGAPAVAPIAMHCWAKPVGGGSLYLMAASGTGVAVNAGIRTIGSAFTLCVAGSVGNNWHDTC